MRVTLYLPDDIGKKIEQEASENAKSIDEFIIDLIVEEYTSIINTEKYIEDYIKNKQQGK